MRRVPHIPPEPVYRASPADLAGMAAFGALVFVFIWWLRDWLELAIDFGTWVRDTLWGPL